MDNIESTSGSIVSKTTRLYLFSGLVFLSEFGGRSDTKIEVFSIKFEHFTISLLQAGCVFVLIQALISLLVHRSVYRFDLFRQKVLDAIQQTADVPDSIPETLKPIIANFNKSGFFLYGVDSIIHIWVPTLVAIFAIVFAIPDLFFQFDRLLSIEWEFFWSGN